MNNKSLEEIKQRISEMMFEESFDLIVAIANGGIIPAALLNQRLQVPVELLKISFRNTVQHPIYDLPRQLEPIKFEITGKNILLVEDRVKTGATLELAKQVLAGAALVKTFSVNGKADYPLYDEACFRFPWLL